MFVLANTYRYSWPATAMVPDLSEPGKVTPQTFQLSFEPLSRDELIAADREAARSGGDAQYSVLLKTIKGWDQVVSVENEPVPFSETALLQALKFTWFRIAAFNAYAESMSGEAARLGN